MAKKNSVEGENWGWYTIDCLDVEKLLKSCTEKRNLQSERKVFGDWLLTNMEKADSVSQIRKYPELYARSEYPILLGEVTFMDKMLGCGGLQLEEIGFKDDVGNRGKQIWTLFAKYSLALVFKYAVEVGDLICVFQAGAEEAAAGGDLEEETCISLNEGHEDAVLIGHISRKECVESSEFRTARLNNGLRSDKVMNDDFEVCRIAPIRLDENGESPFERYAMISLGKWTPRWPGLDSKASVTLKCDVSAGEGPPAKKLKTSAAVASKSDNQSDDSEATAELRSKLKLAVIKSSFKLSSEVDPKDDNKINNEVKGHASVARNRTKQWKGKAEVSEATNCSREGGVRGMKNLLQIIAIHPLDDPSLKDVTISFLRNSLWGDCREGCEKSIMADLEEKERRAAVLFFYRCKELEVLRPLGEEVPLWEIHSLAERRQKEDQVLHLYYSFYKVVQV